MNFSATEQIPLVRLQFPSTLPIKEKTKLNILYNAPKHPLEKYKAFIDLMDKTISKHYVTHDGPNWKKAKNLEMQENGLIYVYYTREGNSTDGDQDEIIAFTSFLLTLDEELVLYLYEIHVSPDLRNKGIGKLLINNFHELVSKYRATLKIDGLAIDELSGTKLTVFTDNEALRWYEALGYELADESPRNKVLRSGKVIKPDYYIMIRRIPY